MVIRTKFRGPTDTRPGRIVATAPGFSRPRRVVTEYSHALSARRNHAAAAMRLAAALGIPGEWTCGEDANGVVVFVRVIERYRATPTFAGWQEVPA